MAIKETQTQLNVLDLFYGCGGLSLGFEKAGYHVLLGSDVWKGALQTYKFNHKDKNIINNKD